MRTIIDIPDSLIKDLDRLAERENVSRAALVREALQAYVGARSPAIIEEAFGLWGKDPKATRNYQEEMRGEW